MIPEMRWRIVDEDSFKHHSTDHFLESTFCQIGPVDSRLGERDLVTCELLPPQH